MYTLGSYAAYLRKAIVNAGTILTSLLGLGLLPSPWNIVVAVVLAAVGVPVHFAVSNAHKPGTAPAVEVHPDDVEDEYRPGASAEDLASVEPVPSDAAGS